MDPILDDIYERALLLHTKHKFGYSGFTVTNTDIEYIGGLQSVKPINLILTEKQVLDACRLLVKNGLMSELGPKRAFDDPHWESWYFRILTPHEIAQHKSKS